MIYIECPFFSSPFKVKERERTEVADYSPPPRSLNRLSNDTLIRLTMSFNLVQELIGGECTLGADEVWIDLPEDGHRNRLTDPC